MWHPLKTTLPESTSFSQSQSELAGYLRHLDTSTLWAFRGHLCMFGATDSKDLAADQPQIRTGAKPNALDGMAFRFNSFMFKNPAMQAYLMSVIASDPAAEIIKESVKNHDKRLFLPPCRMCGMDNPKIALIGGFVIVVALSVAVLLIR